MFLGSKTPISHLSSAGQGVQETANGSVEAGGCLACLLNNRSNIKQRHVNPWDTLSLYIYIYILYNVILYIYIYRYIELHSIYLFYIM